MTENRSPDVIPFNIGIASTVPGVYVPSTPPEEPVIELKDKRQVRDRNRGSQERLVLAGSPAGKTFGQPSALVYADGTKVNFNGPVDPPAIVSISGEELSSLTWPKYLAWRKTKCRPFDRPSLEAIDGIDRIHEEIDQATHEFVGEVAELGELFLENGPTAFWGDARVKLIDEIGDIFFCGAWALDAWGMNPLYEADDLEMIRVTDDNSLVAFAGVIAENTVEVALSDRRFAPLLGGLIYSLMLTAQTQAGLTSNSYKKLHFQKREQDVEKQVARIANVLIAVNQILIVANSSVEEALKVNMKKLDARRPKGYDPTVPGGIRTGEGA